MFAGPYKWFYFHELAHVQLMILMFLEQFFSFANFALFFCLLNLVFVDSSDDCPTNFYLNDRILYKKIL